MGRLTLLAILAVFGIPFSAYGGNHPFTPVAAIQRPALTPLSPAAIDDVREATIKYLIGRTTGPYFLFFSEYGENQGPALAFVERLTKEHLPVKNYSECQYSVDRGAIDRVTGEHGFLVPIDAVFQGSDDLVSLNCGRVEGGLGAEFYCYVVQKINGRWRVIKTELTAIS